KNFTTDAGPLRDGLMAADHHVGDFEFTRHGVGSAFESFMVAGRGIYLICNNTVQSMDGITKDPLWLAAQVPFVELSDQFRANPPLHAGGGSAPAPGRRNLHRTSRKIGGSFPKSFIAVPGDGHTRPPRSSREAAIQEKQVSSRESPAHKSGQPA